MSDQEKMREDFKKWYGMGKIHYSLEGLAFLGWQASRVQADAEIAKRDAIIAMQAEALKAVAEYLTPRVSNHGITGRTIILPQVNQALSASAESEKWLQGEIVKRLGEPVAWLAEEEHSDIVQIQVGKHMPKYAVDAWEPLYRLPSPFATPEERKE